MTPDPRRLERVEYCAEQRECADCNWHDAVVEAREDGHTLAAVAKAGGISPGRVWQICHEVDVANQLAREEA